MPTIRTAEEMREYQRKRRAGVTSGVTTGQGVTDSGPETPAGVTDSPGVTSGVTDLTDRWAIRARLDALKAEYLDVARDQDNHPGRLRAINAERDPLFRALHTIEGAMHPSERYWMPTRYQDQVPYLTGGA